MKRYLYLIFIFNIMMMFSVSLLQAETTQDLNQKDILSDEDINNFLIEKKDHKSDVTNGSNHSFSSLEVSMKKTKESISFDHESMKINLKYIENK